MILTIIASLAVVSRTAAAHQDINLPKFSWIRTRSGRDQSLLSILFSDGTRDFVKFSRRQTLGSSCLWQGNFLGEPDVSVTASGPCPLEDNFEITIVASQRLPAQIFRVTNGHVRKIDLPDQLGIEDIKKPSARSYQRQQVTATKAFPPEGFTVDVRLYSDDNIRDLLGDKTDTAMLTVMGHAEAWFQHPSLTTTISFNVVEWLKYNGKLETTDPYMTILERLSKPEDKAINIFFTHDKLAKGALGIANIGSFCHSYGSIAIVEYQSESDSVTGLTAAHEIGHVLGMQHDFDENSKKIPRYDKNGKSCLVQKGIMNYGKNLDKWSTCSVEDLIASYNKKPCFEKKRCEDKPHCLKDITSILKHLCLAPAIALSCPKSCKKC